MEANSVTRLFPVLQMSCAACALSVEDILQEQAGVLHAEVNYASQIARITYLPAQTKPELLKNAVQGMGYDLLIESEENNISQVEQRRLEEWKILKRDTLFSLLLSLPVFILGMFFMHWQAGWYISWIFCTPVVGYFGRNFFVTAWKQTRQGTANMDSLVALSTGTAYAFSLVSLFVPNLLPAYMGHPPLYFEAAAVVISFILLGRLLEERAKRKTSSVIRKLIGLQVKEVIRILEGGKQEILPTASILPGDILLSRPGDQIAVDGIVTEGDSFVDESAMNGEPVPASKTQGSKVWAGTINGQGRIQYRAEHIGKDTLLSKIIQRVQEAQGSKPPVQRIADRIARIFVPSVLAIAGLTWILWGWLGGEQGWAHGLLSFLTVLVVACPCALGLATPTALIAGMGRAAAQGILVKDASSLELAGKLQAIALDKTGTLTQGKPSLAEYHLHPDANLNLLVSMEAQSSHPLAEALVCSFSETAPIPLENFQNLPGRGIQANYQGQLWLIGNQDFLTAYQTPISNEWLYKAESWKAKGNSLVWFGTAQDVYGLFAFNDPLKPESIEAVQKLKQLGIEVHLLSGDQSEAVQEVARTCGIQHYQGKMLPEDKADYIQKLQRERKITGMVGDGINDSTALATADVSIAMSKGSDIALETAQMTLLNGDLNKIVKAIFLSRFTLKIIHQNLFWAFAYNVLAIPIAAGVLYPIWGYQPGPMMAGAAMALSSICVVGNSLRLAKT